MGAKITGLAESLVPETNTHSKKDARDLPQLLYLCSWVTLSHYLCQLCVCRAQQILPGGEEATYGDYDGTLAQGIHTSHVNSGYLLLPHPFIIPNQFHFLLN